MTNSDRLQEIRERAEKANPGPWKVESEIFPSIESADQMMRIYDEGGHNYDDAVFIAASREDIPWLLQLVTEQQREIDRLRKFWYQDWVQHCTECLAYSFALDELASNFPHRGEQPLCSEQTVVLLYRKHRRQSEAKDKP